MSDLIRLTFSNKKDHNQKNRFTCKRNTHSDCTTRNILLPSKDKSFYKNLETTIDTILDKNQNNSRRPET